MSWDGAWPRWKHGPKSRFATLALPERAERKLDGIERPQADSSLALRGIDDTVGRPVQLEHLDQLPSGSMSQAKARGGWRRLVA